MTNRTATPGLVDAEELAAVPAARVLAVTEAAWAYWRWHQSTDDDWTRGYLARRGLKGATAGYAPAGWQRLTRTLTRRGFTLAEQLAAGVVAQAETGRVYDVFRDRLVLPIVDTAGHTVGFTARRNPALEEEGTVEAAAKLERTPKYLNTTRTALYDKSSTWFGLDAAAARRISDGARPVVVEGALDVEAVKRAGVDVVPLAVCGTAITAAHLEQLRTLTPHLKVLEALDPDTAGRAAAVRLWDQLTDIEAADAGTVTLPDGDPADLIRAGHRDQLATALTHPRPLTTTVIERVIAAHDTTTIEGTVTAMRQALARTARLPEGAAAAATLDVAARLDVDTVDVITEALALARGASTTPQV